MSDCDKIQSNLLNMDSASIFIGEDVEMIYEEDALAYLNCTETVSTIHSESFLRQK